jgi:hypothetical protein
MKLKLQKPGSDRVLEVELPDGKVKKLIIRRLSVREADERDKEINRIQAEVKDGKLSSTDGAIKVLGKYVKPETDLKWVWDLEDLDYVTQIIESLTLVVAGKAEASEEEKNKENRNQEYSHPGASLHIRIV